MKTPFPARIWRQLLLVMAVQLIFTAIAPARDTGYPADRFRELVFIDPSVQDVETICTQLLQGAEVMRLLPVMDGVAQISTPLAKKRDLTAIRIISHGNAGYFVLNGKRIDGDFLRDHGGRIAPWGRALSENGDLLLYACNLAATDEGKAFVEYLVDVTGADVAASTTLNDQSTPGPQNLGHVKVDE